MYLHRFLRMMPLMIAAILLSMSLLRFLGNGPVWPLAIDILSGACKHHWWSTFTFTQNYVNPDNLVSLIELFSSVFCILFFFRDKKLSKNNAQNFVNSICLVLRNHMVS